MEMMLIHVALIVLVSGAWSLERGNNQTNEESKATDPVVEKNISFKQGKDANLTCGDKLWTNHTIMFVIWKLDLTDKNCEINFNTNGENNDDCQDGKSLRNTSEAQPFLFIPNVSFRDVGVYICETVYTKGADSFKIKVNIIAPPHSSASIERRDNRLMAVCKAARGWPAANISWSFMSNSSVKTEEDPDGLITVESSVEFDKDLIKDHINCTINHPYWNETKVIVPSLIKSPSTGHYDSKVYVLIVFAVVFCLGLLFFGKKLVNSRRCYKSSSSKSPTIEDVEEVEPYESYVQRVNSIYNSSRDLFQ